MFVIYRGIETIRWLLNIKAPFLIALGLLLLCGRACKRAASGRFCRSRRLRHGPAESRTILGLLFPVAHRHGRLLGDALAEHSRFLALRQNPARPNLGQTLGLPLTMALYAFIGVAVTSATMIIYGETIWNPVDC